MKSEEKARQMAQEMLLIIELLHLLSTSWKTLMDH